MRIFKWSVVLPLVLLCLSAKSQSITKIEVQLDVNEKERIAVMVFPPEDRNEWRYVIPEIIPGTYMKINYERLYTKISAYDADGNKLKVKKKDNVFLISGDRPLHHLSYQVEQSYGDWKIWDSILACAGTIFTDDSYLLNFQLVSGYFDGFQDQPHRVEIERSEKLYGATSMQDISSSEGLDVFETDTYDALVDQPILYAKADTTSFAIGENKFRVAVHSEKGGVNAEMIKPRLTKIMHAIDSFSGLTREEDYHFIFYYVDRERLKGLFKNFGVGSALEHNQSSIYYFSEPVYDTTFSNLDWIGAHEYFHTITPLSLHSEKIHDFNFETPDMSRHGWLYEGVTDYFAALLSAQYDLSNSIAWNMRWAVSTAEKQKPRSFTKSSQNIIKKNMFSWIGKIGQLGNYYERGKLVAMGLDMELYERTNGEKRLIDVMLELKEDYDESYFPDEELGDILVKYTYPEIREYYERYIEGEEIPPYETYFQKLGWTYHPKGEKIPSYGLFNIWYDQDKHHYHVSWQKKNEFGLKKGDIVLEINGVEAIPEKMAETGMLRKAFFPREEGDNMTIKIRRRGVDHELIATAKPMKLRYPRITVAEEFTPEQAAYRKGFYKED